MPKLAGPQVKFCGDVLRIKRMVLGLSQNDVARVIGVNKQAIHYWEIGKFQPRVKYIQPLAKLLKTKSQYFYLKAQSPANA